MRTCIKVDILNLSSVEVYCLIRDGVISRFPVGFLDKTTCKEIMRWICFEHYHMTRKDICNLTQDFLYSNSLSSFRKVFNYNIYDLISYSFSDLDIKEWEISKVPDNFWNDKGNQRKFILWIAEKENLDLSNPIDVSKLTAKLIGKYGGNKARKVAGGTFELISSATGNRFREWEVIKVDVWSEEQVIEATKWLIEERLKWSDEKIRNDLTASVFQENKLGGMLKNYCSNSPIKALKITYPGRFSTLKHSNPKCSKC